MDRARQKKDWVTPRAVRYGSVKEITLETKEKTWGGSDDVLLDGDALLADAAS